LLHHLATNKSEILEGEKKKSESERGKLRERISEWVSIPFKANSNPNPKKGGCGMEPMNDFGWRDGHYFCFSQ